MRATQARWAHDLEEQAAVAAGVVAFFEHRRGEYPRFHVYHYNHTERSSLAAMTLGTPAEGPVHSPQYDTGLFVDLMAVARNSFQVGVESYGLKALEALAGFQRQGDIEQGVGAVVDYEQYMRSGDPELLAGIARYNEDDVRATQALLGWLLEHRPPDSAWRNPVLDEYEEDPELDLLAEDLLAFEPGDDRTPPRGPARVLAAGAIAPTWCPKFAQLETDTHVLLDDPNVVAGLTFEEFQTVEKARGPLAYAVFSWPEQPLHDSIGEGTVLRLPADRARAGSHRCTRSTATRAP